jgi:mRNA interferase HigB
MRVVGRELLDVFIKKHSSTKQRLLNWLYIVEKAEWATPHDIKITFPKVSILGTEEHIVIFNIGRNYRLKAKINYFRKVVTISKLGSHSEYDKWSG